MSFRRIVFDIETNGLLPELHTLHSLVLRDVETDEVMSCTDSAPGFPSLRDGLQKLRTAESVYGHNIIAFDIPALQKLYPRWRLPSSVTVVDTFITAAMRFSHIKDTDFKRARAGKLPMYLIGRHSLEAWGYRLGIKKGDVDSYEKWTPDMQTYCEQDTAVTRALVLQLYKSNVSPQAQETEHELAAYLQQQERNGWPFDHKRALVLQQKLAARREILGAELMTFFPPWQVSTGIFVPKRDDKKRGYQAGVPIERFKTKEFNPDSTAHIADRLTELYGWKPTVFTDGGRPKVDENLLKGLTYPPIKPLREYLLVAKRLEQLAEGQQAWLKVAVKNDKLKSWMIHGRVNQSGTVTHRATHFKPNVAQVPKVGNPFGAECRELFRVPQQGDWIELGADAAGLELRCLAHYMAKYDNGEYASKVLGEKPNDIHTANAAILGLERDPAKTWFYAWIYGAGDHKLGKIMLPGAPERKQRAAGKKAKADFLKGVPALQYLMEAVAMKVKKTGRLQLIDGREVYTRSDHSALNSLLQGTGAVICKRWIVEFNRRLIERHGPQGWDEQWAALGWIHDEVQLAVRKPIAEDAASIVLDSIRYMTDHFEFRVPLDGEAKLGANWRETH